MQVLLEDGVRYTETCRSMV